MNIPASVLASPEQGVREVTVISAMANFQIRIYVYYM
jgi:hypothetical protein